MRGPLAVIQQCCAAIACMHAATGVEASCRQCGPEHGLAALPSCCFLQAVCLYRKFRTDFTTETGRAAAGNNAVEMETTATFDAATDEFVIHTPTPLGQK